MFRTWLRMIVAVLLVVPAHAAANQKWVATWAQAMTSNVTPESQGNGALRDFTLRQAV